MRVPHSRASRPTRSTLGLSARDFGALRRLESPARIQAFVNALPSNHEKDGETLLSVRSVLLHRRAHCMEAAMLAACALWIAGDPPLLMHLDSTESDYPHVVALFCRDGHWGAISKSNGIALRFRDPVYATLRELAMSYFHEYIDRKGRKTLRTYSRAFDLRRLDPADWVTCGESCWGTHDTVEASRHYPLLGPRMERSLARRDAFEMRVGAIEEYPDRRTPTRK